MKNNRLARNLVLSLLAVLTVFTTFSCKGLFTTLTTENGTLTINMPVSRSASCSFNANTVEKLTITVVSEKTGKVIIPTREVVPGSFSEEIPVGPYSVIVQGLRSGTAASELGHPLVIGRKNGVTISAGKTTSAEIVMIDFWVDKNLSEVSASFTPNPYDWGSGKLPQNISVSGYTFSG